MFSVLSAPEDREAAATLQELLDEFQREQGIDAHWTVLLCSAQLERAETLRPLLEPAMAAWQDRRLVVLRLNRAEAPLGFRDAPSAVWLSNADGRQLSDHLKPLMDSERTVSSYFGFGPTAEHRAKESSGEVLHSSAPPPTTPTSMRKITFAVLTLLISVLLFFSMALMSVEVPGPRVPSEYALRSVLDDYAAARRSDKPQPSPDGQLRYPNTAIEGAWSSDVALIRLGRVLLNRLPASDLASQAPLRTLVEDVERNRGRPSRWQDLIAVICTTLLNYPDLRSILEATDFASSNPFDDGENGAQVAYPEPPRRPILLAFDTVSLLVQLGLVAAALIGEVLIFLGLRGLLRNRAKAATQPWLPSVFLDSNQPSVFASYSRADSAKVDHVVSDLEREGFEVWVDRERVIGGVRWPEEIVRAIRNSRACIVFCSAHAFASDHVFREVHLAVSFGKALVPITLEPVPVPDIFLYYLAPYQTVSGAQAGALKQALRVALSSTERLLR